MSTRRRLLLSPLLLVALATVLGGGTVSASAAHGSETRVRAIPTAMADAVGQSSSETPGSVGCLRPSQPGFVSGSCVATESGTIYRTGARTDGALTDPTGVSFRDSISSSADRVQVFKPWDKIYAVDTAQLPPGSVVRDGVPDGHVSVIATPDEIRAAVFDDRILRDSGLKLLDDGSYWLPR